MRATTLHFAEFFPEGALFLVARDPGPPSLLARGRVLLGPAPVIRQWRLARLFEPLSAALEVAALTSDEVEGWLVLIEERVRAGSATEPM